MNIKRKDREITDKKEIQEIIKKAKILHLGLIDDNYPYIVPLHYGFEYCDENDSFVFFMHGAKKGHKIDLIKNAPNVFVEIETDVVLDCGLYDNYWRCFFEMLSTCFDILVGIKNNVDDILYRQYSV